METSASSIRLDAVEKQVRLHDIGRARRCEPLMSEAEKDLLRAELRRQERAGRLQPGRTLVCTPAGPNFICN